MAFCVTHDWYQTNKLVLGRQPPFHCIKAVGRRLPTIICDSKAQDSNIFCQFSTDRNTTKMMPVMIPDEKYKRKEGRKKGREKERKKERKNERKKERKKERRNRGKFT